MSVFDSNEHDLNINRFLFHFTWFCTCKCLCVCCFFYIYFIFYSFSHFGHDVQHMENIQYTRIKGEIAWTELQTIFHRCWILHNLSIHICFISRNFLQHVGLMLNASLERNLPTELRRRTKDTQRNTISSYPRVFATIRTVFQFPHALLIAWARVGSVCKHITHWYVQLANHNGFMIVYAQRSFPQICRCHCRRCFVHIPYLILWCINMFAMSGVCY